jgi:CheY-like chemotaxis protein
MLPARHVAYHLLRSAAMPIDARVLVADDHPDLLEAVADSFVRLGADVIRASTGAELVEQLAEHGPFDLVVTDVAMPWMTGLQAVHAARMVGLSTSVIVMTGLRDPGIQARVTALGSNTALLEKPFDLEALESCALKLLQRSEPVIRTPDG